MSSSNRTPLQDLTNQDPKEVKRQRDREYYARNRDVINTRRRQARELKKQSVATTNDENTLCDLAATGQAGVTQLTSLHAIEGCSNVSLDQPGASYLRSEECAPVTNLIVNHNDQIRRGQTPRTGQSWYARLPADKKAEYIQRQRIARQQRKTAAHIGVNYVEVSQTPATSLPYSQCTPLSNVTNINANGVDQQWRGSTHQMMVPLGRQQKKATTLGVGMVHQSYNSGDTQGSTLGIGEIGSASNDMTRGLHKRCSESFRLDDDDSDWLHTNSTYMQDMRSVEELGYETTTSGLHCQDSFLSRSAYSSEQTRQRSRERYSLMTDAQRDAQLHKNREYKKCRRKTMKLLDNMHHTGEINSDEDSHPGAVQPRLIEWSTQD